MKGASRLFRLIETAGVHLFFLQAVRVLFSVLFGLIYEAVFDGQMTIWMPIAAVLLLLALLAPLLSPKRTRYPQTVLLIAALLIWLIRIPLTINHPNVRLLSSTLIIACWGIYTVAVVRRDPSICVRGLFLALLLDQTFRALGHTYDLTLRSNWWPVQVIFSIMLGIASWRVYTRPESPINDEPRPRFGLQAGLALAGFLFLETSLLSLPNAAARWTDGSYAVLTPLIMIFTAAPLVWFTREDTRIVLGSASGLLLALLLLGGLVAAYHLRGPIAMFAILLAQAGAIGAVFYPFGDMRRRGDHAGLGLTICLLVLVLLNVAYAFAFTYAYTLESFRGTGLPIFCLAGFLTVSPALWGIAMPKGFYAAVPRFLRPALLILSALTILAGTAYAWPARPHLREVGNSLRLGTYNIHYGYHTDWKFYLEEMAQTIEESGADIVALQEVDTGRPTSYCVDDALWLARRLGMIAIYQPTIEYLTGIALLSRVPVSEWKGRPLTSHQEATAIVWASVPLDGTNLNAYGIWLGLTPEERATQLQEALGFIEERDTSKVSFGGDFNSRPDSPTYRRLIQSGFVDPFAALGRDVAPTSPSESPQERIDYVWIRGLRPIEADVLDSTASDHRMVVIEATLD